MGSLLIQPFHRSRLAMHDYTSLMTDTENKYSLSLTSLS